MPSNPFYVQPGGDYSEGLQGLSEGIDAYLKKKQQAELGAGLAGSYDAEHPVDSYMGGTKPVGEGMGAFPVDPSKPSFKARQELHPDALHTDNFTLEDIMDPMHTQQERMGLEEVGYSPEKHDAMVELADKIKYAPDNEIAGHIKEYIKNGADNGEDMSAIASTMGMDADTVRSHADAVKTLAKRDAFRRIAIADPNAAYKIMSDEQASRKAELMAQKEARLMDYNERNLAMQEKRLNAPSYILQTSIDPATGLERVYAVDKKSASSVDTGIEGKVKPSGGAGRPRAEEADIESAAKAAAELDAPPPSMSSRNPDDLKIWRRIREMNPSYSAKDYYARRTMETKATSGNIGMDIKSNTVANQHLDSLLKVADSLASSDVKKFNEAANFLAKQGFNDNRPVQSFELAKQIVSDEVVSAIIGKGKTAEADRAHMQAVFDAASDPDQLKKAAVEARELIGGQLIGLRMQYMSANNTEEDWNKLVGKKESSSDSSSIQDRIAAIKAKRNASK